MKRVAGLLLALLLALPWAAALGLSGCTRSRAGVQFDELRVLANWIEDTSHGIPRRSGELELFGATADYTQAAQWAAGSHIGDQQRPPSQIQARMTRAPALAAALRSQVVLIDGKQGLVGPAPGLSGAEFLLAAQIADAENHDRRTNDAIVLSRSRASAEAAVSYREAVRVARVTLDTAAGGHTWQAPVLPR